MNKNKKKMAEMKAVEHFTHPGHSLSPVSETTDFTCVGCKKTGFGLRYRCTVSPNFDLHDICAKCPPTIDFFMHPDHPLEYVPPYPENDPITCNACGDRIHGTLYEGCNFRAHPCCAHLPQTITAPCHPEHPVTAVWHFEATTCQVCQRECGRWRFRCNSGCGFQFHLMCLGGIHQEKRLRKRDFIFRYLKTTESALKTAELSLTILSIVIGVCLL